MFLNKTKTNLYSPIRVIRYDICILTKLPTSLLFQTFAEITRPFWGLYCPDLLKIFEEEYFESKSGAGWQYYLPKNSPKTNCGIGAPNRTLKDSVAKRKAHDFDTYYQLLKDLVLEKSAEAATNPPKCPSVPKDFYTLAPVIADKSPNLFLGCNGEYPIKDIHANPPFLNKNKKSVTQRIKKIPPKIGPNDQFKKEFLKHFTKPLIGGVKRFGGPGIIGGIIPLDSCKARKITKRSGLGPEYPLAFYSCTCPNSPGAYYCLHVLGILIHKKFIDATESKKKGQRGRPPNVPPALMRDRE